MTAFAFSADRVTVTDPDEFGVVRAMYREPGDRKNPNIMVSSDDLGVSEMPNRIFVTVDDAEISGETQKTFVPPWRGDAESSGHKTDRPENPRSVPETERNTN